MRSLFIIKNNVFVNRFIKLIFGFEFTPIQLFSFHWSKETLHYQIIIRHIRSWFKPFRRRRLSRRMVRIRRLLGRERLFRFGRGSSRWDFCPDFKTFIDWYFCGALENVYESTNGVKANREFYENWLKKNFSYH